MGALRTLLAALAAFSATQAVALPHSPAERAQLFASCAGRFAALEEHQRMFDGPASERSAALRAIFVDLLDAVLPDAQAYGLPAGDAQNWRVAERAAQRSLLDQATFAADPLAREAAEDAARHRISACTGLIPSA